MDVRSRGAAGGLMTTGTRAAPSNGTHCLRTMIAHHFAMITGENDPGIVQQLKFTKATK